MQKKTRSINPYKGISLDAMVEKVNAQKKVEPLKPKKTPSGDYRPRQVLQYWRQVCALHYPEMQLTALSATGAEIGIVKHLLASCGTVDVLAIIDTLVPKWQAFTRRVNHLNGWSDNFGPQIPVIGYVLKHIEIAMNYCALPPETDTVGKKAYYE